MLFSYGSFKIIILIVSNSCQRLWEKKKSSKVLRKWQSKSVYTDNALMSWPNFLITHIITVWHHLVWHGCCSVAKSCPTLFQPLDCSPPGSSVHGVSQARILEWVAISFSKGSSWWGNPLIFLMKDPSRDRTRVTFSAGGFFKTEPPGKPI